MKLKQWIYKLIFGSATGDHPGAVILRLFIGGAMMTHGYAKLFGGIGMEKTTSMVESLGFPVPALFAFLLAFIELFGALFLALGFATRLWALLLAIAMTVAAFVHFAGQSFSAREFPLLYLAVFIFFLFQGGGKISIDGVIRGRK